MVGGMWKNDPLRPVRHSVKAVIIEEDRILLTHNRDDEGEFYLLPGGGQRPGETAPEALRRECREELGVEVQVGPFLMMREYIGRNHEWAEQDSDVHQIESMFRARVLDPENLGRSLRLDDWQLGAAWLPLAALPAARFYPMGLRSHLAAGAPPLADPYLGDLN
jgi:ADP-ribose pyrophosphatase YjhB (NUDIX family)